MGGVPHSGVGGPNHRPYQLDTVVDRLHLVGKGSEQHELVRDYSTGRVPTPVRVREAECDSYGVALIHRGLVYCAVEGELVLPKWIVQAGREQQSETPLASAGGPHQVGCPF